MNRRDELDAMYVILRNGCAGMICFNCPGAEYDYCGDYNKAVKLYDADWRKQIEAEWIPKDYYQEEYDKWMVIGYTCSKCKSFFNSYYNYCAYCGAKMNIKGE